jgi:hypothetical protein
LAQPTAENDPIGPTPAARHAHTLARRGGLAPGSSFGLCGEYHHGKEVASGKVEDKRVHPGGGSAKRWQKTVARDGLSTAMALR